MCRRAGDVENFVKIPMEKFIVMAKNFPNRLRQPWENICRESKSGRNSRCSAATKKSTILRCDEKRWRVARNENSQEIFFHRLSLLCDIIICSQFILHTRHPSMEEKRKFSPYSGNSYFRTACDMCVHQKSAGRWKLIFIHDSTRRTWAEKLSTDDDFHRQMESDTTSHDTFESRSRNFWNLK